MFYSKLILTLYLCQLLNLFQFCSTYVFSVYRASQILRTWSIAIMIIKISLVCNDIFFSWRYLDKNVEKHVKIPFLLTDGSLVFVFIFYKMPLTNLGFLWLKICPYIYVKMSSQSHHWPRWICKTKGYRFYLWTAQTQDQCHL
jgi:hypothetical protein